MRRSKRRSIYCDPVDWADIGERAADAGMTKSAFAVACALQDDVPECPGTGLVLTEEEPRRLYAMIERLERGSRALLDPAPGIGMSVLEALAVLVRAHGGRP